MYFTRQAVLSLLSWCEAQPKEEQRKLLKQIEENAEADEAKDGDGKVGLSEVEKALKSIGH